MVKIAHRSLSVQHDYNQYLKKLRGCPFCRLGGGKDKVGHTIMKETDLFWVVKNKFPYVRWDARPVEDHLMVVPKRHVDSTSEMTEAERNELMDLIAETEPLGFSFYGRSLYNDSRSIAHQHTHLLKVKPAQ
jgi:diadenosine tetraphosphate (Ap4A) HIT family hydrolase